MITLKDLATSKWGARMPVPPEEALLGAFFMIQSSWNGQEVRDHLGKVVIINVYTALRALDTIRTYARHQSLRVKADTLVWQIVHHQKESTNAA